MKREGEEGERVSEGRRRESKVERRERLWESEVG